ncbi:hypothetical protein [Variovorax sp. GB1P17]|uniref:hypothetical protein n=1 Tax=Variovorax sp. GB1P17 TaxID=3443740 RepID=UPI003F448FC2
MHIRKATKDDVPAISALILSLAHASLSPLRRRAVPAQGIGQSALASRDRASR